MTPAQPPPEDRRWLASVLALALLLAGLCAPPGCASTAVAAPGCPTGSCDGRAGGGR